MVFTTQTLQILITLLTALFITSVAIPTIVTVAKKKGLNTHENGRSSHKGNIPVLGGIGIYMGLGVSVAMWTNATEFPEFNGIFGASLILLGIGMKDDILLIDPYKKLFGEIIAALLIVLFAGVKFTSFQGTFGMYELGFTASIIFSVFVMVLIINAFNLIDGIDGLASGVGILASAIYSYWFFRVGDISFSILSVALAGALIAFFYFNVFGNMNKILMGDTGALMLGMVISVLTIRFCELNISSTSTYQLHSAPGVAIAILSIPLFDALRVFIIRIFRRKSPFGADRNHIHHIILDLNFTHVEVTFMLLLFNGLLVLLAIAINSLPIPILTGILLLTFFLFSWIMFILKKRGVKVRREEVLLEDTKLGELMIEKVPSLVGINGNVKHDSEPGKKKKKKDPAKKE